jgi:DNA-binding NarL/FixJ family response regulator
MAEAGFEPVFDHISRETMEDPAPTVVLLTIRAAADWEELTIILRDHPTSTTVAILCEPGHEEFSEALRLGANGVVRWDASLSEIVSVICAACKDTVELPQSVALSMARHARVRPPPGWITDEEVEWLQILSQGATVLVMSEQVGYSERSMYRLLHSLYSRMEVANRTEAVLRASQWGLLEQSLER